MKLVGRDHIIGFAFGNEMLIKKYPTAWWTNFTSWVDTKIAVLDREGFTGVPITVVWSFAVVPHVQNKDNDFINHMHHKYGDRWVWAVNPYSIWDPSQYPSGLADCHAKSISAVQMSYV